MSNELVIDWKKKYFEEKVKNSYISSYSIMEMNEEYGLFGLYNRSSVKALVDEFGYEYVEEQFWDMHQQLVLEKVESAKVEKPIEEILDIEGIEEDIRKRNLTTEEWADVVINED